MRFKSHKVWIALDAQGRPAVQNGKVLIKYQLHQDHQYWVHEKNIHQADSSPPVAGPAKLASGQVSFRGKEKGVLAEGTTGAFGDNTVVIFADGASSGNPGPSGIGILLRHKGREREISRFIGITTNNVAELEAIRTGLLELKSADLPVRLFTDSRYAQGVLSGGWKAKKNQDLIRSVRLLMAKFKDLRILHVKGHAGDAGNERANRLAVLASKSRGK